MISPQEIFCEVYYGTVQFYSYVLSFNVIIRINFRRIFFRDNLYFACLNEVSSQHYKCLFFICSYVSTLSQFLMNLHHYFLMMSNARI